MMEKPTKSTRLTSIDMLRGLVIVLMALDHSRDFFGDMRINPHDAQTASVAMYLTRFVTHFCAPTFVLLAGISAWLYGSKQSDPKQLSWFLFSRGLWLLILDHTVLWFGYGFNFEFIPWIFLVISAIGIAMMLLSVFCWLPTRIVGLLGLLIMVGHNLLDPIQASVFGAQGWIWNLIHEPGFLRSMGPFQFDVGLEVAYPVFPWFGVMAAGYGLGPIFKLQPIQRRRLLMLIGYGVTAGFFIVRGLNIYGDPQPWSIVESENGLNVTRTAMSFGYCCKYPPSLCYCLMTLGPALIVLSLFEHIRESNLLGRILLTFGRVPLFFYVVHFYLLQIGAIATYWLIRGKPISPFQAMYGQMGGQPIPDEFGFPSLVGVYAAWFVLLLVLFPLCVWYGKRKRAGKSRLWSYL